MSDTLRELVIKLGFDVDSTKIPQIDQQLSKATTQATSFDKAMGGVVARFAGPAALGALAYKGFGMVKEALVESSDAAIQFGRNMASIQTIIPKSPERVQQLSEQIQQLAINTGKSSAEVAAAVNDVLQAFDDSADTMKLAEIATRGATASGTDARTAFDLLSTSLLQFGTHGAEAAQQTMDMAFAMRQFGKVEIAQFAHGMGEVAGSAHQLGVSQKELFGILGTTAGITGPVDQTFTQLNGVIMALETPTKDLQKVYKDLGITSIQAAIAQDGLFKTLKRVHDASDGTVESLAKLIPDARAQRIAWPLVTTLANRYAEAMDRVDKSAGAAAEADSAFRGGLNKTGTALDQLDAKTKTMQENFGKRLGPMAMMWKQAWLDMGETAIKVIDQLQDKATGRESGEGVAMTGLRVAAGIGDILGGYAKGAAKMGWHLAGFEGGAALDDFTGAGQNTMNVVDQLLGRPQIGLSGADLLRARAGTHTGSGGVTQPERIRLATTGARQNVQEFQTTNIIHMTVPEGADPETYQRALESQMYKTIDSLARNVRNANSGDNP